MAMVNTVGMNTDIIKANGLMANNMDMEYMSIINLSNMESGSKAKKKSGSNQFPSYKKFKPYQNKWTYC